VRKTFGDFIDKKQRDTLKQLGLLKKLLERNGMKVESFLETDEMNDPYIFCMNPMGGASFDGVRIYKVGSNLAFRVQKESQTHPYGNAYPLNVEEMFHDLLSDEGVDQTKAGERIIEMVGKEVKKFFEKSIDAERGERQSNIEGDAEHAGNVLVRTSGTDYSSLVYNKA